MRLASDTKGAREPGGATGPIRVLHVDDDPAFGDVTATYLEREYARLSVETATSASDGLDRLRRGEFDCVVSDYSMPGRNGIDFLEAVRKEYLELPFILFTGKGSEEVASEAISVDVTDYLQKGGGTNQYALLANRIRNSVDRAVARREHRRHLSAIETAREGISILDEDGRFVYMNRAYADLFGYDPGEMLGEHWTVMYDEQGAREVEEEVLPVLEETGYWRGETTRTLPDGETVTVDHTLATTDNGEYVCIVRDITDQQETARELRKERKLVDRALDTLDDLFYVVGANGELIRWNERVSEVTGYTDEEIADMRATEFFPEDERERVGKAIEETLTAGELSSRPNSSRPRAIGSPTSSPGDD